MRKLALILLLVLGGCSTFGKEAIGNTVIGGACNKVDWGFQLGFMGNPEFLQFSLFGDRQCSDEEQRIREADAAVERNQ